MFYHFSILILFRPFIKLRFVGSAPLRATSAPSADAITTRCDPTTSYTHFSARHPSSLHRARREHHSPSRRQRERRYGAAPAGAADLRDMCKSHGFSGRGLDILAPGTTGPREHPRRTGPPSAEMLANMCTPVTASLNLFAKYGRLAARY